MFNGGYGEATEHFWDVVKKMGVDPKNVKTFGSPDGPQGMQIQLPDGTFLRVRNQGSTKADPFNAVLEHYRKAGRDEVALYKVRYK